VKVCIDIQAAVAQRAGVGRYTRMLLKHLADEAGDDTVFSFHFDFARRARPPCEPGIEGRVMRWCPGRLAALSWRRLGWPAFDRLAGPADVYHFPNFLLPPLRRGAGVVTIHDVSFMRYPRFAEERNLAHLRAGIRSTVARADAVVTDSEFSADEIRELLDAPPEKVFPVYPGVTMEPPPEAETGAALDVLGLRMPYLLNVGTVEPRKNLDFLLDVFERLSGFGGSLVLAGMPGWKCEPILRRMRASPVADRIRYLDYVPEAALPALYAGASLFLFPSLYEGFGFPPLEAMACGTPVIASNRGPLPEVLGDAAVQLDVADPDSWVAAIRELVPEDTAAGPGPQARELIEKGRRRAAGYTWQRTARRMWEVYRSLEC
jgi:glycosyltransferase involved in cell wall biosynthesis